MRRGITEPQHEYFYAVINIEAPNSDGGTDKFRSSILPTPPMILNTPEEFIAELEGAVEAGSPPRRARMLQQVTQLFASSANRLNERRSVFSTMSSFG
jgi:hypothetical protein